MIRSLLVGTILAGSVALLHGQSGTVQVYRAELSVPFGTVPGKLILHEQGLVFLDDERPEASFAAPRSAIVSATPESGAILLQLRDNIRDRSGERNRVSLRFAQEGDGGGVVRWFESASPAARAASGPASGAAGMAPIEARHKHRLGGCRGRLMITDAQVAYESIDEVADSRRWEMKDIKELQSKSPYEIEIDSFTTGKYKLELAGTGLDRAVYNSLVDRVTSARAGSAASR